MIVESKVCTYATSTGLERALGLWVTLVGHYQSCEYKVSDRIKSDTTLVYCVGGSGKAFLGGKNLLVHPGDVLLLPAHLSYDCSSHPEEGWDIWWVRFEGSYALQLLDWLGLSVESPLLHVREHAEILSHFRTILELL